MSSYDDKLKQLQTEGLHRTLPDLHITGKYVEIGGKKLLNLNGNDYLGLLDCPELWEEFVDTCAKSFTPSSASSRLLTGNDSVYTAFERLLTEEYHMESALIWDSGYHANSGILPALADHDTLIIADRLVHASIVEGIRLSKASFVRYRHNDLDHLEQILNSRAHEYEHVWIVTEGVFSMDGDRAPLSEIVELKHQFGSVHLYVDEAHSVGILGHGLGLSAELGLLSEVDILIGTLGKALGSVGAFSLQSETIRHLLISRARPFIFSTALPPVSIAWSMFLFRKIRTMECRRQHLRHLMEVMSQSASTPLSSPITAVIIPGIAEITAAAEAMQSAGFYVRPIRRPTVPAGTERLRLSLNAAMTVDEVNSINHILTQWR